MQAYPTGTITFLFTDIENSTQLWEQHAEAMKRALAKHDALLRRACEANDGYVFKTVGDAFCVAFASSSEALNVALIAQRALQKESWDDTPIKVRMALHTGEAEVRDGDYFGQALNRIARLLAAGYGGQILISSVTQKLIAETLPVQTTLRDLGEHRLKGLISPEHIYQLVVSDLRSDFPPLKTLDAFEHNPFVKIKVLLVDDDVFNREGIRLYLQSHNAEVVEAGDESTAWALAEAAALDVAVLDISIPPSPASSARASQNLGIQLARRLKQRQPNLGIVLFSAYEDRGSDVLEMISAGVRGIAYKLKGCSPSALLSAIHEAMAGRVMIDPEVHSNQSQLATELLKQLASDERMWVEGAVKEFAHLTPREQEIAHRLAASHNTEGIAQALSLSPKTTENYIGHVYDKLGLNEMGKQAPTLRKVVVLAKACMIYDLKQ